MEVVVLIPLFDFRENFTFDWSTFWNILLLIWANLPQELIDILVFGYRK